MISIFLCPKDIILKLKCLRNLWCEVKETSSHICVTGWVPCFDRGNMVICLVAV